MSLTGTTTTSRVQFTVFSFRGDVRGGRSVAPERARLRKPGHGAAGSYPGRNRWPHLDMEHGIRLVILDSFQILDQTSERANDVALRSRVGRSGRDRLLGPVPRVHRGNV